MGATNTVKAITIYCRRVSKDGRVKLLRRVLRNCSWEERSISSALKSGNVLKESVSIRIFCASSGVTYVPPHEWAAMPERALKNFWTVDLRDEAHPLIVPFESDWVPDAGTEAEIARAENAYIRKTPGALRIAEFNDNRQVLGSHIRLRA